MVRRTGAIAVLFAAACSSFESNTTPSIDAGVDAEPPSDAGGDSSVGDVKCEDGIYGKAKLGTPIKLATDGIRVYWLESEKAIMRAAPNEACSGIPVAQGPITAMAVDATHIVWAQPKLRSLRVDDLKGTPAEAATGVHPSVVLNAGKVFWLNGSSISMCTLPCASTTVAMGPPEISSPTHLATAGPKIFYFAVASNNEAGTLFWNTAASVESTAQGPLAKLQDQRHLIATSSRVIWVSGNSGEIYSVPHSGGMTASITSLQGITALAAEEGTLYVATLTDIFRMPSDRVGELTKLAEVSKRVTSMLVFGTDLIYALEDGTIRRVAR